MAVISRTTLSLYASARILGMPKFERAKKLQKVGVLGCIYPTGSEALNVEA